MRRFSKVLVFVAACVAALILTVRQGGDGIRVGARRPRSWRICVCCTCTPGPSCAFGIVVKFESPLKSFESRSAATETEVGFG